MPLRLRPTAPLAADAILVGDPGRALLLAQELLSQPKMSNHARGLWGYSGETPGGRALTIQSTGMGGPSAGLVLADLAELGVRRAIRVGSCTALAPGLRTGELVAVTEAHAWAGGGGGRGAFPDPELHQRLLRELGASARTAIVASLDAHHLGGDSPPVEAGDATDMQTAALFERGAELGLALAALLIVAEGAAGEGLDDGGLEAAARRAGVAASATLTL